MPLFYDVLFCPSDPPIPPLKSDIIYVCALIIFFVIYQVLRFSKLLAQNSKNNVFAIVQWKSSESSSSLKYCRRRGSNRCPWHGKIENTSSNCNGSKIEMRVQYNVGLIFYHFFLKLSGPDIFMSSHVSFQSYHINACFILPRGAKITPRGQEKKMTISPVMIGYFRSYAV